MFVLYVKIQYLRIYTRMVEYLNLFSLLGALLKCSWEIFPSARPFLLDTNLSLYTFLFPFSLYLSVSSLSLSTFLFPFSLWITLPISFIFSSLLNYFFYQLTFPGIWKNGKWRPKNYSFHNLSFSSIWSCTMHIAQSCECPHLSPA